MRRLSLDGHRFGRLRVICFVGLDCYHNSLWLCECDCGQYKTVVSTALRRGLTQSCGCLKREVAEASSGNFKHGYRSNGLLLPEYVSWRSMTHRCTNEKAEQYSSYGALGVTVCARWTGEYGFENFLADMGNRPKGTTLGRYLDLGNYEPENCEWQTPMQQGAERRGHHAVLALRRSRLGSAAVCADISPNEEVA